jgi:uncharacterized protein YkwD
VGLAAAILAVSLGTAGTGAAKGLGRAGGTCAAAASWGTPRENLADDVVRIVNRYRVEIGVRPLRVSAPLTRSATWKARHMAHFHYFGHSDPAPPVTRTAFQRLAACGFGSTGSENIAYGYPTALSVVRAWLGSPGHRRNIELPRWKYMGVGVASSRGGLEFWAQNFGS